jgi:hypothetical protein
VSEILARVTQPTLHVPRGSDVVHRIRVPRSWLESGAVVELELPRNLSCAACDGGGCDACDRAGAVTLRQREELPEIVQVTLPVLQAEADGATRSVVIRIPEQGGLPPLSDATLPRGLLLLRVELGDAADPGVMRVLPPEPPLARRLALSLHSMRPDAKQARVLIFMLAVVMLAGLALLAFRRHRGLG